MYISNELRQNIIIKTQADHAGMMQVSMMLAGNSVGVPLQQQYVHNY